MEKEAERIARGIYDGTITQGQIDPEMTSLVAEKLRDAVIEGFGKDLDQTDYNTADYKKLAAMENNVFQFSGAKNYQMLEAMRNEMFNPDGTIRPYNDFKNRALGVVGPYNGNWLHTEYNTAVASAQMAAKWVEFEKNKKYVPYLQYTTAHDNRVRPSHEAIDGVIRHIDDAFWDLYYPPNGWNCRCDVIAAPGGRETPLDKIIYPDDVPPMFQTNFAKYGYVFPKGHPYYIGLPETVKQKAIRVLTKRIDEWSKTNLIGKSVTNETIGSVSFNRRGIKELLNQPHEFYVEKNQTVYNLEAILKTADLEKTVRDFKGHNKYIHYLKFKIRGKFSYIVIKESWKGDKTVYSIVDKIK